MESWQQISPLKSKDHLLPYQEHIHDWKKLKVHDLWLDVPLHPPWRSWKVSPHNLHMKIDCDLHLWREMVNQRKIHITKDPNILRWGNNPNITFTLKEGYHQQENLHNQSKENL
jgi:hypothetical protein